MKLSGVIESTAVAIFSDPPDVQLFAPDFVSELVRSYRFVEYPRTVEQFKTDISLMHGAFEGFVLDKLTIYTDGVFVSTQTETNVIDKFIDDLINLMKTKFGTDLTDHRRSVFYNSRIEVFLNPGIEKLFEGLGDVCGLMDRMVSGHGMEASSYRGAAFSLFAEKRGAIGPGRFHIEPRAGHELGENCFYSEAPVTTKEHSELLEALERLF